MSKLPAASDSGARETLPRSAAGTVKVVNPPDVTPVPALLSTTVSGTMIVTSPDILSEPSLSSSPIERPSTNSLSSKPLELPIEMFGPSATAVTGILKFIAPDEVDCRFVLVEVASTVISIFSSLSASGPSSSMLKVTRPLFTSSAEAK